MYKVVIPQDVQRQLKKLDSPIQTRILSTLERIKIRPQDFVEKLVGEPGFKLRVGDYRVFLDIFQEDLVILLIEISHRKNAYKN